MTEPYVSYANKIVRVLPNSLEQVRAGVEKLFFEAAGEVPPGASIDWNEADNGFSAYIPDDDGTGTLAVSFGTTASGRTQVTVEMNVGATRTQLRDHYSGSRVEFREAMAETLQDAMNELVSIIAEVSGPRGPQREGLGF